jgi:hypothetical protein
MELSEAFYWNGESLLIECLFTNMYYSLTSKNYYKKRKYV